jgi:uncharacterized protein (DUF1697 family)
MRIVKELCGRDPPLAEPLRQSETRLMEQPNFQMRTPPTNSCLALIRGVNVGGKVLSMERLRETLTAAGFANVSTYIQSGNIIFRVARGTPEKSSKKIEELIRNKFDLDVSVIVRTSAELQRIIAANPFISETGIDESRLHVTFLARSPARVAIQALAAIPAGADRFHHAGTEIYLHCPNGYGKTKLSNNVIERVLAVRATTRNWNTVRKLAEMLREGGGS